MAEAEEHNGVALWVRFVAVVGVLLGAVFSAGLETIEQVLLVGKAAALNKPAEIFAVHVELLLATFGIIYSAEKVAPTELAGPLAHAYRWLAITGVFSYCCVLLAGVLSPQRSSDTSTVYLLLRVVLPDIAAIVMLVHAVLKAQLVERGVRKHVDL